MGLTDDLIAPEAVDDASLCRALEGAFGVAGGETSVRERTYLDTFDARLRGEDLTLRLERGRFELFAGDEELPGDAAIATLPGSENAVRAVTLDDLPPGGLRDRVVPLLGVRVLVPRARVRVRVQPFAVLDELEKTVGRVAVEVPSLLVDGRRPLPLSIRLRLRGLRGYDDELRRVRKLLGDRLRVVSAERSLLDEAVTVAGGAPEGVHPKVAVELGADDRADRAASLVLRALLEVMEANLPGTVADLDPEFLHDLRVSVRRTRSVQRELKTVFPAGALAAARADFKWIQTVTGEARDLDVHVLGFEEMRRLVPEVMRDDLDPLLIMLRTRRAAAHRAMVRELRSDELRRILDEWAALLGTLPASEASIGELAAERIRKVYRRMVKMGRAMAADSPPEAYHDLRKKGKELRYLLELFGEAAARSDGRDVVKRMTKELKGLQDLLGHHQDREVQMAMLRAVAEPLASTSGGPTALMATGVLLERLEDDAAEARSAFAGLFKEFAGKPQRRCVREVFGG